MLKELALKEYDLTFSTFSLYFPLYTNCTWVIHQQWNLSKQCQKGKEDLGEGYNRHETAKPRE